MRDTNTIGPAWMSLRAEGKALSSSEFGASAEHPVGGPVGALPYFLTTVSPSDPVLHSFPPLTLIAAPQLESPDRTSFAFLAVDELLCVGTSL